MEFFYLVHTFSQLAANLSEAITEYNRIVPMVNQIPREVEKVIEVLLDVPGMTVANPGDFEKATPIFTLRDGSVVRIWINFFRVRHIFITNQHGFLIFGGFVGWIHTPGLKAAEAEIRNRFSRK